MKQRSKNGGPLQFDECFGYTPLLGLGGSRKVDNLRKVKITEHIDLITESAGKVGA
ncbi:T6SS immunity protein Tdi1 domain-containing protein [uncultured Oscillibacter sp.]|uniref:T6SS immunity protein Tdi1 domain-containing protein n=1 Tax=uncultured Oscillibacter sp. TaxID=876091 RepID=UPI002632483B|nr:T6SS immunity protein Tdi1 domain-containing protein [uncultured Oscillibacter sp.]